MPHFSEHSPLAAALDPEQAEALAEAVRVFGAGSRLRLLFALVPGELTVDELAERTGLGASATSHQLRLLRHGRLVSVRRAGRHAFYRLYDHHVAELLSALLHHHEHVRPPAPTPLPEREQAHT